MSKQDKIEYYCELLRFLIGNDDIIFWTEVPDKFRPFILDASSEGIIASCCASETYGITVKGREYLEKHSTSVD